jgi:hypothetical protein
MKKPSRLNREFVLLLTISGGCAIGQTTPTVQQKAEKTVCSNIVALTGNVDIKCSTLTPAQEKAIESVPGLLKKILANQNPDAVMAKLNELLTAIEHSGIVINAPISQIASAPCTANAIGGNVDLSGCDPPKNPYKPVVTYEPDGVKRMTEPDRTYADDSLVSVFTKAGELEKAKDWNGMVVLSESTRSNDPGWFTLDLIEGEGEVNLCRQEAARNSLERFIQNTEEAPNFASLRTLAQSGIGILDSNAYKSRCFMQLPQ